MTFICGRILEIYTPVVDVVAGLGTRSGSRRAQSQLTVHIQALKRVRVLNVDIDDMH